MIHDEMMGILSTSDPCSPPPGFSFPDTNPATILPPDSDTITLEGGLPPFSWTIEGTGFTLDEETTQVRENTVNAAGGAVGCGKITCTDFCETEATYYIRSTVGEWVQYSEEVTVFTGEETDFDIGPSPLRWVNAWRDQQNMRQMAHQVGNVPAPGTCPAGCVEWCSGEGFLDSPVITTEYTIPCQDVGGGDIQCWGVDARSYYEWERECAGQRSLTNWFCYCSDFSTGTYAWKIEDGNTVTFLQNLSYIAVDFSPKRAKTYTAFRVYFPNASAKAALEGCKIQYSNDSTNGSDGNWTDMLTITAELIGAQTSGWSDWMDLANQGSYQWYRLSGMPKNNNTVLNEWDWAE